MSRRRSPRLHDKKDLQGDSTDESESLSEREESPFRVPENKSLPEQRRILHPVDYEASQESSKKYLFHVLAGLLVSSILTTIGAVIFVNFSSYSTLNKPDLNYPRTKVILAVDEIRKIYKNQNKGTFEHITVGLNSTPSVFMLIYNGNKEEAECIPSTIKKYFKEHFHFEKEPIELKGPEIKEEEQFDFLEEYTSKLNISKLMIVYNLDGMSADVAENFHSFCDVENPLIPDAVIIFTLKIGDKLYLQNKNPLKKARTFLEEKWKNLSAYARDTLITRLITNAIEINKEDHFSCPYK
ncbi:uncharacterized protein LOC106664034 isoform X2 [Cimex lectularius]|uniref:Uncharacterized protein n=1 Tax=Cimex lectularius TaxID=79782 RepID=A0A8I6RJ52_CIMLE|nr:uncharacterized protein LOC106664034 isoform X2 [Cimex lectularius]XP_014244886.1 uncharacterized protein LOC106664034 isoform X2 [Cimex lectularius]